jgi:hypothetical protein
MIMSGHVLFHIFSIGRFSWVDGPLCHPWFHGAGGQLDVLRA